MVTMVGLNPDFEVVLKNLIKLEYAAVAAYHEAIAHVQDGDIRRELGGFLKDHERHIEIFSAYASHARIEPPTGPDAKVVVTTGKVKIAELVGDKAILLAMKTNEDDTVTAYTRACEHMYLPPEAKDLVEAAQADERRHRDWMESTLHAMDTKTAAV